jgi:very-short-patch-repair endonuclease
VGSSAQWRDAGLSPSRLRSLIRRGYLVEVRRGAFATRPAVAAAEGDPRRAHALQVAAVRVCLGRDTVGSYQSAALIHGFDLLTRPAPELVTLTCRPPVRRRSRTTAGVLFRSAELPASHVTRACGTTVTTPARTVIDLARILPFMDAVVVADSALHTGKTTKEELANMCKDCARWPGIGQARRVVAFSNGLAESVLESCARVTFDAFRLESPEIQVTVRGDGFVFRADFCWEPHKTIAETDGLAKYATSEDMLAQFRRDRLLRDAGYKVVHFTWRELFDTPELVISRVRKALASSTAY